MPVTHFDIVIVGAGIAGSAMAALLAINKATEHLRIALIDTNALERVSVDKIPRESVSDFDSRVSALTLASEDILKNTGAWTYLNLEDYCSYTDMQVWDGEGTGTVHFNGLDVQQSHLGMIIENKKIATAFLMATKQHSQVTLLGQTKVVDLQEPTSDNPKACIILDTNQQLTASLVIGADGALSRIRSLADFKTREWDYQQSAIVATVKTGLPHKKTAWQCFTSVGPLAFLPLHSEVDFEQFCSIVWSVDNTKAQELYALGDNDFCAALTDAFEGRLGDVSACSSRQMFPLKQRHATDYTKNNVVLIGDAAHTIHPLAGQGINLGLQDALVLSQELGRLCERQLPLGGIGLKRYQRRRKGDNLAMMAAMEGFKRLFSEESLFIRAIRGSGMSWFDESRALKKHIIKKAMGIK